METHGMVNLPYQDDRSYELSSLRSELLLRIALQNLLLIVAVIVFVTFASCSARTPTSAWLFTLASCCANFALVLQWCHHGIRTRQIKQYLMLADGAELGWERWLPAHRPARLLGSRWMISTKGVFLGLTGSMLCLAAWLESAPAWPLPTAAVTFWAASAGFLFTNPKE
jgi:hypothetical protein